MIYYIFLEDGTINGAGQARQLTEGVENIEVSEAIFNTYIENPEKYIYSDGEIIENPNYDAEQAQRERERKITELKEELKQLDLKAVRPLRALVAGNPTDEDNAILAELEQQAQKLRIQILEIEE